ncbi:MAG: hypothetical protein ACRDRJ_27940 [Streptosporangiaceae bacterium]
MARNAGCRREVAKPMYWAVVATIGSPLIILIPVAIAHDRRQRLLRTLGAASAGRILELGRGGGMGGGGSWARVEYQRDRWLCTAKVPVRHNRRDYQAGQRVLPDLRARPVHCAARFLIARASARTPAHVALDERWTPRVYLDRV